MWIASATPATLKTRCDEMTMSIINIGRQLVNATAYLGGPGQHAFTRIQPRTARVLYLFYFRTLFPNDRSHPRVGNHEFDSHCTTSRNRGLLKWFVIDPANNETKRLERVTHDMSEGSQLLKSEKDQPWRPRQAGH